MSRVLIVPQERRRRSVQSKNAEAARHDLYDRAKGSKDELPYRHIHFVCVCVCVLCAGSVDLDSSGNLRPSPSQGSAKMAALQRALHGKEVSLCMQLKV